MRVARNMAAALALAGGAALFGAGCLARGPEPVGEDRTDPPAVTAGAEAKMAASDMAKTEGTRMASAPEERAYGDSTDLPAPTDAQERTGEGQQPWWGGFGWRPWWGGFGWRPWWGGYGWNPWWGGFGWRPWWGGYGWNPWWGW